MFVFIAGMVGVIVGALMVPNSPYSESYYARSLAVVLRMPYFLFLAWASC